MMIDDEPFEALLENLKDGGAPLRAALIYRLSEPAPADLASFQAAWESVTPERKRLLFSRLVETSENNFEVDFSTVALFALQDEDAEVRCYAIGTLWENEHPNVMQRLIELLQTDLSDEVRATAAMSLGRFVLAGELETLARPFAQQVETALLGICYSENEPLEVHRRSLESISYSGHEEVPPLIEQAAQHQNIKVQASALFAMGRSADRRWAPNVIRALNNPEPELRFEAARAAGELGLAETIPRLIVLSDEPDREVKEAAIWALGEIGGDEALRALMVMADLEDDESLLDDIEDAINMAVLSTGDFATLILFNNDKEEDIEYGEDVE